LSTCGASSSLHGRRRLFGPPPRSPPAYAPSTTISLFVQRNGDTEGGDLVLSRPGTAGHVRLRNQSTEPGMSLKTILAAKGDNIICIEWTADLAAAAKLLSTPPTGAA